VEENKSWRSGQKKEEEMERTVGDEKSALRRIGRVGGEWSLAGVVEGAN
jgi:hypothetical protein